MELLYSPGVGVGGGMGRGFGSFALVFINKPFRSLLSIYEQSRKGNVYLLVSGIPTDTLNSFFLYMKATPQENGQTCWKE